MAQPQPQPPSQDTAEFEGVLYTQGAHESYHRPLEHLHRYAAVINQAEGGYPLHHEHVHAVAPGVPPRAWNGVRLREARVDTSAKDGPRLVVKGTADLRLKDAEEWVQRVTKYGKDAAFSLEELPIDLKPRPDGKGIETTGFTLGSVVSTRHPRRAGMSYVYLARAPTDQSRVPTGCLVTALSIGGAPQPLPAVMSETAPQAAEAATQQQQQQPDAAAQKAEAKEQPAANAGAAAEDGSDFSDVRTMRSKAAVAVLSANDAVQATEDLKAALAANDAAKAAVIAEQLQRLHQRVLEGTKGTADLVRKAQQASVYKKQLAEKDAELKKAVESDRQRALTSIGAARGNPMFKAAFEAAGIDPDKDLATMDNNAQLRLLGQLGMVATGMTAGAPVAPVTLAQRTPAAAAQPAAAAAAASSSAPAAASNAFRIPVAHGVMGLWASQNVRNDGDVGDLFFGE